MKTLFKGLSPRNAAAAESSNGSETTHVITVEFSVSDSGIGIPIEHVDKLGIPFFMVNKQNNSTGTGLGLSICKRIIEKMNSKLIIKSQVGVVS